LRRAGIARVALDLSAAPLKAQALIS